MPTTVKLTTLPHYHGNNLSWLYGTLMRTLLREFLAQVGQKRYTSLTLFWIPNSQQNSHHKSLTSIQSMHHDEFLFYHQQYKASLWSRFIFCKVSVSSAPHIDKSLHADLCLKSTKIDGEVHNVCPGTDPWWHWSNLRYSQNCLMLLITNLRRSSWT